MGTFLIISLTVIVLLPVSIAVIKYMGKEQNELWREVYFLSLICTWLMVLMWVMVSLTLQSQMKKTYVPSKYEPVQEQLYRLK